MNFELRRRVDKKEPDEAEFNKLANSLDAFTSSLLNPLKSGTEDRLAFADSLDDVMDVAIDLEQKKVHNRWIKHFLNKIVHYRNTTTLILLGQGVTICQNYSAMRLGKFCLP